MKKLLLFTIVYFTTQGLMAQSADKGRIKINGGVGIAILNSVSNENVNGKGTAVPTHRMLSLEYNTHDRVSFGFEMYSQTYLTSQDDSTINRAANGGGGFNLQYHFVNKPKFNAYVGTSVGGFKIDIDGTHYPDTSAADPSPKQLYLGAYGVYNTFYFGLNKYFGRVFGIYVKGGFMNYPARMDYVNVDGDDLVKYHGLAIEDWKWLTRGGFLSLGITVKFREKKEEKVNEDTSGN